MSDTTNSGEDHRDIFPVIGTPSFEIAPDTRKMVLDHAWRELAAEA
jgi:hypothetical protein